MSDSTPVSVAVAESCTGGLVMAKIVAIPGAGDWFHGGVVAYEAEVKFELLAVERGPVVTADAAIQMATGVRRLLGADLGLATTGVAGPDTEEGQPVGTVFLGLDVEGEGTEAVEFHFDGSPDQVREEAAGEALEMILTRADRPPSE